ncbi:hypothetical protein RFI_30100, partial [Reticulomyxa filosa]
MGAKPSKPYPPLDGREFEDRAGIPQTYREWLELKKKNDQNRYGFGPHLWCIHNKLYDLRGFLASHPGGEQWLKLTQGTECTAGDNCKDLSLSVVPFFFWKKKKGAFETHHLDIKKVSAILEKYYVGESLKVESEFDWDNSNKKNFFVSLREEVLEHLQKKYPKNEWKYPRLRMHVLSACAFALWSYSFWLLIRKPSLKTSTFAGLCLHPFLGVGHNFFHQADFKSRLANKKWPVLSSISETWWRYLFDFTGFSWRDWRISHVLSHHVFINLDSDYEVSALEPLIRFMANQ